MWVYQVRCEGCKSMYDAFPSYIEIGPINDLVVLGKERDESGIEVLTTERLYKHEILLLNCPRCLLRVQIAKDLFPSTMKEWLSCHQELLNDLKIENLFKDSGKLKEFPLKCPRCSEWINIPNMKKCCKFCGSTQLSVIKSNNTPKQTSVSDAKKT